MRVDLEIDRYHTGGPTQHSEPLQVEKAIGRQARCVCRGHIVAHFWVFSFVTVFRNALRTVGPHTV